jgi:hypothetical protein
LQPFEEVDTPFKEVFHAGREVLQEAYSFLRGQIKHGLLSIPNGRKFKFFNALKNLNFLTGGDIITFAL